MRETKIVASDSLPRQIIAKILCSWGSTLDPIGSLITASWIWLGHIAARRKGMERKRKKEN